MQSFSTDSSNTSVSDLKSESINAKPQSTEEKLIKATNQEPSETPKLSLFARFKRFTQSKRGIWTLAILVFVLVFTTFIARRIFRYFFVLSMERLTELMQSILDAVS